MDKLYGLIQEINPKEICNHIENGNLAEWCSAWRIAAKEVLQPKTNADRIRAMSDDELIEFIKNIKVRAALCKAVKNNDAFEELCSAEWLKQPAE